jgi:chorismate mutase / prephenate dehydratase
MRLDELRALIDGIDDEILALLERRARIVSDVGREKREAGIPLHDPEREKRLLERLSEHASSFPREAVARVFREIMSACLAIQEPIAVSFLGPEGTFSHIAAREIFGLGVRYVESATIDGVFDAVRRDVVAYGVVPIENSTEGSVTYTVDSLLEGGLFIRRELALPVVHALLSTATSLPEVKRVYSHPQALAQCRGWLTKQLGSAQLVQTPSTVAAVHAALGDPEAAAIASQLASELYGIPVLRKSIQDLSENATRFVLLAKSDAPPTGHDKTTLAFSVKDERGALKKVLDVFESAGINLTRIESRPSRARAWDYVFLADLEGHREDEAVARALQELSSRCDMVLPLGSYPRATPREG